ncbi:MAG TPA: adenosylcobalamin-dependent ribonucleoside-diphosphate reductase [Methanosarcina sp.]|nr:adenosylcobalamin-dependent ribonucleoside-diphosphate reductase [Methanosarcina sp.]
MILLLETEKGLDLLAAETLKSRYLGEGEKNWEDICERVAKAISTTPEEYIEFHNLMVSKVFLPSSPTLMNAGTASGQLSACFVIPVEDDIEEIFDSVKIAALIQKTGGGTGFDFSKIRPDGYVGISGAGNASGPVVLMGLFNEATEIVKRFGRRRGANMGILDVSHNDIIPFIRAKNTEGSLSNFNISVMVPDAFMSLAAEGRMDHVWNPETGTKVGKIFSAIVEGIWKNGEPGVLFYDRINRDNFTPALGNISATNPCGEEPLLPFESCNLGSINLSLFVKNRKIHWDYLRETVKKAVRFLDNEIDVNVYPVPKIEETTRKTRKVGLGVMGFHDMLLKLNLPYDSIEAIELAGKIMEQINWAAIRESRKLAAEKGPFPEYENSIWELPIRNATLTAIAPTGTISILAGCSAGIEPVFSWVYRRARTAGKDFMIVHPFFESHFKPKLSEPDYYWLLEHIYTYGTLQDVKDLKIVSQEEKLLFKSALDIRWKTHIDMQAAFQRHCHAGISKTINMPAETGKEDIEKALIYAWKQELKGLTIYRTGSRQLIVLSLKKS